MSTSPTESWAVRPAAPDDAEAIESVRIATWKACYRGIVPDAHLNALSVQSSRVIRLRTGIERAEVGGSLVAVAGSRIIGMGFAGPPEDDQLPEGTGEVFAVYVLSEWQGRGVGRALLERLTSGLRALGYRSAVLWTLRDRLPTRRFYEANGWELDGAEDSLDLQGPVHLVRYARNLSESA
ncbi:MAG: GNAT family N-acetyltransferase [Chloroflexota bacterium]|nr:GNAT family N-acetyltransferase [Chloroflexota bacterium]MDE2919143.1 GNAT family N-acetyltransferase [Chloroflexota bacterium]